MMGISGSTEFKEETMSQEKESKIVTRLGEEFDSSYTPGIGLNFLDVIGQSSKYTGLMFGFYHLINNPQPNEWAILGSATLYLTGSTLNRIYEDILSAKKFTLLEKRLKGGEQ